MYLSLRPLVLGEYCQRAPKQVRVWGSHRLPLFVIQKYFKILRPAFVAIATMAEQARRLKPQGPALLLEAQTLLNVQQRNKEKGGLGEHANGNADIRYKDDYVFVFPQKFWYFCLQKYIKKYWNYQAPRPKSKNYSKKFIHKKS